MTSLPLVSICIPTYNAGDFFEACLQSALAQTYSNIEILISDDGSTDDTLTLIKKYQQAHAAIRLIKGNQSGMVNNWNNCIEQAAGEWIKFLFQDDILQPACVEKMLAACLLHKVPVGLCRRTFIIHNEVPRHIRHNFKYTMVLPERVFENEVYISPERLAREMAELLPLNALGEPTSYLFHKNIFEQTGMFNPDYNHLVDLEFILRVGLLSGLVFLAEPLAQFRVHGKSQTSANLNEEKETLMRNIAALTGDNILLFHDILHSASFTLLKEAMGADVLQLKINYLYYSGCKHKGVKLFNNALAPIRKKYKELGDMKYSFFKYSYHRKRFRKWEQQSRM